MSYRKFLWGIFRYNIKRCNKSFHRREAIAALLEIVRPGRSEKAAKKILQRSIK